MTPPAKTSSIGLLLATLLLTILPALFAPAAAHAAVPADVKMISQPAVCSQWWVPWTVKAGTCNTWKSYSDGYLAVAGYRTRHKAIAALLATAGSGYQVKAHKAGWHATHGTAVCRTEVTYDVLRMVNQTYKRGEWSATMTKLLEKGLGHALGPAKWAGELYTYVVNRIAEASRTMGLKLYVQGTSRGILYNSGLDGCQQ